MSVWSTCPYSVNNKCVACKVLKITCDGERYINCEQYLITTKKKKRLLCLHDYDRPDIFSQELPYKFAAKSDVSNTND